MLCVESGGTSDYELALVDHSNFLHSFADYSCLIATWRLGRSNPRSCGGNSSDRQGLIRNQMFHRSRHTASTVVNLFRDPVRRTCCRFLPPVQVISISSRE